MSSKKGCPTYNFSVAIVKNDKDEFLAVKETKNRGWWLPAGRVDGAETFEEAAVRETLEEAGVKIKLKGILRVERTVQDSEQGVYARMRVVFYAEPDPPHQVPKVLSLSRPRMEEAERNGNLLDWDRKRARKKNTQKETVPLLMSLLLWPGPGLAVVLSRGASDIMV